MRCPVDESELTLLPEVPGLAERCSSCGGLWLEPEALRGMGGALPEAEVSTAQDPRRCSRCELPMERMKLPEVELDVCPHCRALWLDAGELETLRQLRQERIDERLAFGAGASSGESSDALGGVFGLLGTLGDILDFFD